MDNFPISAQSLELFFSIDGKQFSQQYKNHLSDYHQWSQKAHASEWILFAKNLGEHLNIDETALSNGELYTIVTSKSAKGKQGAIVAMVRGTQADNVIKILQQIPARWRDKVKEITLDMVGSMNKIVRQCFPKAVKVIDRFHVQKLALEVLIQLLLLYIFIIEVF